MIQRRGWTWIAVPFLLGFAVVCRAQSSSPAVTKAASSESLRTPVSTNAQNKANEADVLSPIVLELRKGFDNQKELCEYQQITGKECDAEFRKAITYRKVTLSPRGQEGIVVELRGGPFCGSGGCTGYLLRRTNEGFKEEGVGFTGIAALKVGKTTTNGFYDLISLSEKRYGGTDDTYKWDGSKYVKVSPTSTATSSDRAKQEDQLAGKEKQAASARAQHATQIEQTNKQFPLFDASVIADQAGKNVSRYVDEHMADGYVRLGGSVDSVAPMPRWSDRDYPYPKGEFSFISFKTRFGSAHTAVVVIVSNAEAKKWSVGENATIVVKLVGEEKHDTFPVTGIHTLVFVQKGIPVFSPRD